MVLRPRAFLPAPEGLVVVWVMLPLEMADHEGYALLMREVLRHEFPFPWCHHIRTIVRDDSCPSGALPEAGQGAPTRLVRTRPEPEGDGAIGWTRKSRTRELPLERRLQAVLLRNGGHGLLAQALRPGDQQVSVAIQVLSPAKATFAMSALDPQRHGRGASSLRGNKGEAVECFQACPDPCRGRRGPPLPVLTNVVLNLANLRMSEKNWAEAESYYVELQKLASDPAQPFR